MQYFERESRCRKIHENWFKVINKKFVFFPIGYEKDKYKVRRIEVIFFIFF